VVVWRSISRLVSINEVNLRRARLVLVWVTMSGSIPDVGHLSQYVTSHPGQLSLAIHLWLGATVQWVLAKGRWRLAAQE